MHVYLILSGMLLLAGGLGLAGYLLRPRDATGAPAEGGIERGPKPDRPQPFGYRMAWLAVRTENAEALTEALEIGDVESAGWAAGLAAVHDERTGEGLVYVTPPVGGWTFVVGLALPHPSGRRFVDRCTPLLMRLSKTFGEAQYYFTYPVIDLYAWARAQGGQVVRAFASGDEGVVWNVGRPTAEEREIGLEARTGGVPGREPEEFPGEADVIAMAGRWGLDPTGLESARAAPALGFLGRAPAGWKAAVLPSAPPPRPASRPQPAGRPALRPVT